MSLPEILAPGSAAAETAAKEPPEEGFGKRGVVGDVTACDTEGVESGVFPVGVDGESSTTHIRWERVATSLATVWASVESGLTWKTAVR